MANDFKEEDFFRKELDQDQGLPDDLIEEIDAVLGQAVLGEDAFGDTAPETELHFELDDSSSMLHDPNYGVGEMQQILMDMMCATLRPLARYVKAFQFGEHYEETLDLCDLLITPVIPHLEKAMMTQPMEDLAFFKSVVLFARNETDPHGRKIMKSVVHRAYKEVQKTFDLRYRGSRIAVVNLIAFLKALRQSPTLKEEDISRFFAIGVPSLTWVRRTSSQDLTSLSGIPIGKIRIIRTLAKEQSQSKGLKLQTLEDVRAPIPQRPYSDRTPLTQLDDLSEDPFIIHDDWAKSKTNSN